MEQKHSGPDREDLSGIDMSKYFLYFGHGGQCPYNWQAVRDPTDKSLLNQCLEQTSRETLEELGLPDLGARLQRLEGGYLIKRQDTTYVVNFPAIVGKKRAKMQQVVEGAADSVLPATLQIIEKVRPHLDGRDEMLFHVLWSVIMDGEASWSAAENAMLEQVESGDTSIKNKGWLVYPDHPYKCGTNSHSSSPVRITWSRCTPGTNEAPRAIAEHQEELIQAIHAGRSVSSAAARQALGEFGLVDKVGLPCIFLRRSNTEMASLCAELGREFARSVMGCLNIPELAGLLSTPPGVTFVTVYHEVCWQLLQDLDKCSALDVPRIVREPGCRREDTVMLVSMAV